VLETKLGQDIAENAHGVILSMVLKWVRFHQPAITFFITFS
jgi:hypothetical protein